MDYNVKTGGQPRQLLTLTLPSGAGCRAWVHPAAPGKALIGQLVEQGLIAPGRYEFISELGVCEGEQEPLGALFAPGAVQACARLRLLPPEWPEDYASVQELYGCPAAVTAQTELLTDCMVARTEL